MAAEQTQKSTLNQVDTKLREILKQAESRGKNLWEQRQRLDRKNLERDVRRLRREWKKRANALRNQAYHAAGLATQSDLDKLKRKLTTLSKKA